MRYVIVGAGAAGTTAAEELRRLDPASEVILISQEQHPLYSRVLLLNYIQGKTEREKLFLKKETWYEEKNIEWLRGVSVTALDVKNRHVELAGGREIPYDKLLITTGAEPRVLGEDFRGVSYLRTLDDADHLLQLLKERTADTKVGIFGGGFIACEYVKIFDHYKLPITLACRSPHFWSKIFDEETGQLVNEHVKSHGVDLVTEASFKETYGDKELEGFRTSKGDHPCSILGVGAGVISDLGWIKEAGIDVGTGIKINQFLKTNIQDVYAAGDVAQYYDSIVERELHIKSWINSMMQARAVARIMTGEETEFQLVQSFATKVFDLDIIFVGDVSREHADEIVVRGSVKEGGVTQLFVRNKKLVGASIVGRNKDRAPVTSLIQSKQDVSDFKSLE